jgi:hypothetical protein
MLSLSRSLEPQHHSVGVNLVLPEAVLGILLSLEHDVTSLDSIAGAGLEDMDVGDLRRLAGTFPNLFSIPSKTSRVRLPMSLM